MKNLNSIQLKFWNDYLSTLKVDELPKNPNVEAQFAGNREITDELLQLYLTGKKYAGSGVVEDYETAGDPIPQAGNYWILLNSKDEPGCLLLTEKVVFNKFKDVPVEIAIAEGEGDLSLDYWRKVHSEFYRPFLKQWGISHIDSATIITEFFKLVFVP